MAKFKRPVKDTLVDGQDKQDVDSEVAELEVAVAEAAKLYLGADVNEKQAKKVKDAAKERFNEVASRLVELTRPLMRMTVVCSAEDLQHGFGVDEWVKANHPGYRVHDMEQEDDGNLILVLEEDPALQKYHVVVDDKVVGRTRQEDADQFDAEEFVLYEPKLAQGLVRETMVYELLEDEADRALAKDPGLRATLQRYTTPGPIKTKMLPVRKAKEDD